MSDGVKKPLDIGAAFAPGIAAATPGMNRCTISFEDYLRGNPIAPGYQWGRHTHEIARVLQQANDTIEAGGTFYCIINVPPRHGKSDLCSRRFPAYFLCRNPDCEVILATYAAELSESLSISARRCFDQSGPKYGLKLSKETNTKGHWLIEGCRGGMLAVGIGGAVTGNGAHFLGIDDYCRNRADAESDTIRESVWDEFRSTLMTRLAPSHAVVIVATRWHEDDLVGRIIRAMAEDPAFPRFQRVNLPAWDENLGWLFLERYSAAWYESQRAALGTYAFESLFQGNPHPRGGAFLKTDKIQIVDEMPKGLRWTRAWDLASTAKERLKDNPDYTAGALVAFHENELLIADVRRGQWTAPKRDEVILKTVEDDGPGVRLKLECVAGYKDTGENIKARLNGCTVLVTFRPEGDKAARATIVESYFEFGRVKILRGPWNAEFIAEVAAFPRGKKDDQVDCLVSAAEDVIQFNKKFTRLEML